MHSNPMELLFFCKFHNLSPMMHFKFYFTSSSSPQLNLSELLLVILCVIITNFGFYMLLQTKKNYMCCMCTIGHDWICTIKSLLTLTDYQYIDRFSLWLSVPNWSFQVFCRDKSLTLGIFHMYIWVYKTTCIKSNSPKTLGNSWKPVIQTNQSSTGTQS